MKQKLSFLLALIVMLAMAGCGSTPNSAAPEEAPGQEAEADVGDDTDGVDEDQASSEEPDTEDVPDEARPVTLAEWAGTWNNFMSYFEAPELDEAYEILAEEEDSTPEAVKERYLTGRTYEYDVAALGIQGDVITVYESTQDSVGGDDGILSQPSYTYQGEVEVELLHNERRRPLYSVPAAGS